MATASSSTATSPDRPTSGGPLAAEIGLVTVREGSYVPPAHYFFARTFVVKRAAGPARPDLVEPVTVTVSLVPFAGSLIDVVERLTVRVMFSPAELRMSTCWLYALPLQRSTSRLPDRLARNCFAFAGRSGAGAV